jgi:biopolymer transport protein ExbB
MGLTNATGNEPIIEQLAAIFRNMGVGWVMWLLIALSILSVAVMIERAVFFTRHSFGDIDAIVRKLAEGDLDGAVQLTAGRRGLEADVLRQGAKLAARGADSVEEMVEATIVRGRLRYERFLFILGTLGNNAPFIGLFGTVLGIVEAFAALAANAQNGAVTQGSANIMSGISEALVATAVGLMVALPAVAIHNVFGRWLKTIIARSECIGHALSSCLKAVSSDPTVVPPAGVPAASPRV